MRRGIRITLWSILAILLIAILVVGGGTMLELATGFSSTELTNVSFNAKDGETLGGYLATPTGEGPFPAVLLIHEWWGLNEDITRVADQLAAEGYVVLAADAYRGTLTEQVPRAIYISATSDQSLIESDLDDAFTYLSRLPSVNADAVAVWGFCFGGSQALAMGTRNPDVAAVVDFYGSGPITNPDELGVMEGPLLGVFGAVDNLIPLEEVSAFEMALKQAGVEHTITIYPDVGHAFLNSENLSDDSGAAGQAWLQTLAFFDTHLR